METIICQAKETSLFAITWPCHASPLVELEWLDHSCTNTWVLKRLWKCMCRYVCSYQTSALKCRKWIYRHVGFPSTKQPVPIPVPSLYQEDALDLCSLPLDFCSKTRNVSQEFLAFISVWYCWWVKCYGGDNGHLFSCKKCYVSACFILSPSAFWVKHRDHSKSRDHHYTSAGLCVTAVI